jgi:hypothetical protein
MNYHQYSGKRYTVLQQRGQEKLNLPGKLSIAKASDKPVECVTGFSLKRDRRTPPDHPDKNRIPRSVTELWSRFNSSRRLQCWDNKNLQLNRFRSTFVNFDFPKYCAEMYLKSYLNNFCKTFQQKRLTEICQLRRRTSLFWRDSGNAANSRSAFSSWTEKNRSLQIRKCKTKVWNKKINISILSDDKNLLTKHKDKQHKPGANFNKRVF